MSGGTWPRHDEPRVVAIAAELERWGVHPQQALRDARLAVKALDELEERAA